MRRWMVVFLTLCLAMAPCWAQTFSVAILEDANGTEARELSDAVLGGCMDFLFASGRIATNESIGRVENKVFLSKGFGISAAREGFVDYLALVWIRYVNHPTIPDIMVPEAVHWRLVRVEDGDVLAEGVAPPPVYTEMTAEERREDFKKLGGSLADQWTKAL